MSFEMETLSKVSRLIGFGKAGSFAPSTFNKLCGTTAMIVFLLKDCLEYSGIATEKKFNIQNSYRLNRFNIERSQRLLNRMGS